jgi:NTE family protein
LILHFKVFKVVRLARQLGTDVIIAVDVSKNPFKPEQLQSTFAVMQQAIIIMSHKLAEAEASEADILIRPEVGGIAVAEFELRAQAVAAGEAAALALMEQIKTIIAARDKSKINYPDR